MKKILALSAVAAFVVSGAMADQAADIAKLDKEVKKLKESLAEVKKHDGGDNIKWDVDFRTAVDMLDYKSVSGEEFGNDALLSNRLWLGMGYAVSDNLVFKGQLSMHKAYGAASPSTPSNAMGSTPQRGYSFDAFDWVNNENLADGSLRVRQAYWLYKNDSLFGSDVSWTASFGRRPSTNGFLVNLRDDDKAQSPLGHVINMEFDGASFKFGLDKLTGVSGMYWKLCLGRGLTNAGGRFQNSGMDYTRTDNDVDNTDLAGFIFVPYDDGQYTVETTYYRGFNVPGLYGSNIDYSTGAGVITYGFGTVGDMDGAAVSFMANGIGDGISDFLDDTILFASFGWSKTHPDSDLTYSITGGTPWDGTYDYDGMLGYQNSQTGTSYWLGAQIPAMITDDGRFGFEFNHGSKFWRPFTYGEDTMAGSKLAARGDAYEVYYTQPLMEGLSMQIRATQINYDYTGSQGFFGQGGQTIAMEDVAAYNAGLVAQGLGNYQIDPVEKARDIRFYIRYRY